MYLSLNHLIKLISDIEGIESIMVLTVIIEKSQDTCYAFTQTV